MGLLSHIFGKRKWEDLPIKFVDSIKSRTNEHNFKVLQHLAHKYDLLSLDIFKNSHLFTSNTDLGFKALSFSLVVLGNRLTFNNSIVDAENCFLLSLMLNPKNTQNPSHCCLAILYALNGRTKEAQAEAKLALFLMEQLQTKIEKILNRFPESKQAFLNSENPDDLHPYLLTSFMLTRMIHDISIYGSLVLDPRKSDLMTRTNYIITICAITDPDLQPLINN